VSQPENHVPLRDLMEARFAEVGTHARYIREALDEMKAVHHTTDQRLGALETTAASMRMRLETVEARVPLMTLNEGRLLAKATGIVSAVVGTLWGAYWAVTHWALAVSTTLGMARKS
jgi:hypothetical protein